MSGAIKRGGVQERPRLEDLAKHVGVSVATVSRVLNGRSGVSRQVRQSVLTAMDDLGYERADRALGTARGQVGIIVADLVNPIFPAIAQSVVSLLSQEDFIPVLCALPGGGRSEDEYIELLTRQGAAGIVFICGSHADGQASMERYHRLQGRGISYVLVNGSRPELEATSVANDDAKAIFDAVQYLSTLGHRKIGLSIGPHRFLPSRSKIEGFRTALKELLDVEDATPHIATSMFTIEGGQTAASELIQAGHTAIVCASDLMALGAVRAARSLGLRVPEDVSVIGFDDSPLMALTDPPLTTLRQPVGAIAHAAVQALISDISGEASGSSQVLLQSDLVLRGSTGPAPSTPGKAKA
jgi:LacI family transcriptional regulator, repressor for deo operon, udp, cdd, tsx, nupC, and nupG